jgi:predicted Fe-S protein YdhL (DUF1289 family)
MAEALRYHLLTIKRSAGGSKLPSEERTELKERLDRWQKMSPAEKKAMRERVEERRKLSPMEPKRQREEERTPQEHTSERPPARP